MKALFEKIFKLSILMAGISAGLILILTALRVKESLIIPVVGITFIVSCIIAIISGVIATPRLR